MKIALTGTPGTGKSTISDMVDEGYGIVHINDLIKEKYNTGSDHDRDGALIADLDGLSDYVDSLEGNYILEGHVSHLLPVDAVIVLRASPSSLRERLKSRGWKEGKVRENVEAEALDVILIEAMSYNDKVYEINTTNMTPTEVRDAVREIIKGSDRYAPGSIDFSEEAFF